MSYILIDDFLFIDPPQLTKKDHTGQEIWIIVEKKRNFSSLVQLNLTNHYILKDVTYFNVDYKVVQLHFHWGDFNNNITGSEHLLENRSYPLEVLINFLIKIFNINVIFRCILLLIQVGFQISVQQCLIHVHLLLSVLFLK